MLCNRYLQRTYLKCFSVNRLQNHNVACVIKRWSFPVKNKIGSISNTIPRHPTFTAKMVIGCVFQRKAWLAQTERFPLSVEKKQLIFYHLK